MPHISLQDGSKVVDLELEIKSNLSKDQIIQYFQDWIAGKPMQSKNPRLIQKLYKNNIPVFKRELLKNPYLKNFIVRYYDETTWNEVEILLKK